MEQLQLSLRRTDVTFVASVRHRLSGAAISALLHFCAAIVVPASLAALEKQPLTFVTSAGPHPITVEVANNDEERATGLMFRRSIGENEGMLFIYDREQDITMWMKNTYISLDMIFVRRNGVISHIETNTEPFSQNIIDSEGPAFAVIEMGSGSARRLGLKPGDHVRHAAFK